MNIILLKHRLSGYGSVLVLSIASLLCIPSCQSLDFPDPNAPTFESASVQALVTGLESGMRLGISNYIYGTSAAGREAYNLDGLSDPRWIVEYIAGRLDPNGPFVAPFWGPRYRVMVAAQKLLDRAKSLPANSVERNRIEGFANTVIGHQLMAVASVFQRLTIQIPAPDNPREVNLVAPSEGYAEAARRLDAGFAALQNAGTTFSGGPNGFTLSRGYTGFNTPATFARFNRALRARLAAWQGDYATVLSALQQSFIVADTAQMRLGCYLVFGTGPGDLANTVYEPPMAATIRFWVHPSFERDCENPTQDRRFLNNVAPTRPTFSIDGLTATRPFAVFKSNVDPIPIIRNEELLLLRAEANIRGASPNIDAARNDLNIIRRAAGVPEYTSTTFTASNALDRLLYERRYSLFGEGHRWIDMRRFNRLSQLPIDRPGDVIPQFYPVPTTDGGGTN
ncbi:MAG: RagB/SusD family nutrient uptake outer membrane protein [Bacteroidota bacterium]|nr:RagB/SusD family nutrient uptake outer membrane protein [Candidatus Kapabacteria bacterium]MDW8219331.1 RagB/SusD family nutrient uptake outer membrane protein [Bacteroidota bacterium]